MRRTTALLLAALSCLLWPALVQAQTADIHWRSDYNASRKEAERRGLPLVIEFVTDNCFWCRRLEQETFAEPAVARLMNERLNGADSCSVNSRHHQAVKQVASGFQVSATAPDGVIEAIEDPSSPFCMGVQWHPENFFRTGEFRPLFEGFVEVAARS